MTDADGRVTSQSKATTRSLTWTSFDGVRTITDNGVTATYIYDAFGQIVRTDVDAATDSSIYRIPAGGGYDYAVYKRVGSGDVVPVEWTLFGRGRMGVSRDVASSKSGDVSYRRVGTKLYELTDHLGSVRALVPDIKLPSGGSYIVEPVSVYEYDAYGIARVTRSADLKEPYRYGFQGMLRMSEVAPSTTIINDYATLFRTYDARTGRWTSHDPILQPWESTYAGLAGNPAMLTDWLGLTTGGGDQPAASNSDASKPGGNSAPPQPSTAQTGGGQQTTALMPMPAMNHFENEQRIYGTVVCNPDIYGHDLFFTRRNEFSGNPDGSGTMVRPYDGQLALGEYDPIADAWTIHVPVYWSSQDRKAEEDRKTAERIERSSEQLKMGIVGVFAAPAVIAASITAAPYVAIAAKAVTSAVGRLVMNGAAKVASKVLSPGTAVTGGAGAVATNEGVKRSPALQNLLTNGLGLFQRSAASRVFWSGGDGAKNAAATYARENGLKTLEMTWSGRIMNSLHPLLPRTISRPIWESLSEDFAKGTVGTAHFFTTPAGPRLGSVWLDSELPILMRNGVDIMTHIIERK